jgi:predicted nucleotidyltransferase component of viral defense system
MITKPEVIRLSKKLALSPQVVEKDYVLGWILAGISAHPVLKKTWVFKGGTCLKKCYFKEYRFSEDLDFTVLEEFNLSSENLFKTFKEIAEWIYESSGIQIPEDKIEFESYENKQGTFSYQGKLSYAGPLAPTSIRHWPRIKLDLTSNELIVNDPVMLEVHHPYSDCPFPAIQVLSYNKVEIFSEKFRALFERTRPRDLYDVVHLSRIPSIFEEKSQLLTTLNKKFAFKGIDFQHGDKPPEVQKRLCERSWEEQLSHQIHGLEKFEIYWRELEETLNQLKLFNFRT